MRVAAYRIADAVFALLLINALLVFGNIWPTPWPDFRLAVSPELGLLVAALAAWRWRGGRPGARGLLAAAAVLLVLIIGRYADVTAPALYGRPVNLYWDLPHVANVTGMLVRAAPVWATALVAAAVAAVLLGLYVLLGAAVAAVNRGMDIRAVRIASLALGLAVFAGWLWQLRTPQAEHEGLIARPVTATWISQALHLRSALAGADEESLPASPDFAGSLAALGRRDVMVTFLESYGAVADDRPELATDVASARALIEAAAREAGLETVSAFVTSPTFGGNSWLAHLSFLSGIEVRDPSRYALLMTQQRPSFGTPFGDAGYRRVGLFAGLKLEWPEGAFYRYDTVLDERRLDYRGPDFGWWRIPDQYTLARFAEMELAPTDRAPVFAVFANVNTHLPFAPIPPLQADWARMLTDSPYDQAPLANALAREPRWTDMTQDYADSLRYAFASLAGFVRLRGRDAPLLVILGDHQPAANVSGRDARWDVPVHVLAPAAIAARLRDAGFVEGATPRAPALAPMHELAPLLIGAFSDGRDQGAGSRRSSAPSSSSVSR